MDKGKMKFLMTVLAVKGVEIMISPLGHIVKRCRESYSHENRLSLKKKRKKRIGGK